MAIRGGRGLGGQEMRRMKRKRKGRDLTKTILVDGARMKDKSVQYDVESQKSREQSKQEKKVKINFIFSFPLFFLKVNVCVSVCVCVDKRERKMLLNGRDLGGEKMTVFFPLYFCFSWR